jgi:serine/threonine-protein kinase RsbT
MLELHCLDDVIRARLAARELVRNAGLGVTDQTRFATAVSELGLNAVDHAGAGTCTLADLSDAQYLRLQASVSDSGTGIADVERVLRDGYALGGSLGAGLPGVRRMVDAFDIDSTVAGTCVQVQIVRERRP